MYLTTLEYRSTRSEQHWLGHLLSLAFLTTLLVIFYWLPILAAVNVWWVSPTYSHCFLIIPTVAYLIWAKRKQLREQIPRPFPKALLLALPVLVVWIAGTAAAVNEAQQIAIIGLFQILLLVSLGPEIYRIILFPSLFLFALVPTGEYLVGPLQTFTTKFISVGLDMLGILHYTEGNIIQLANGAFQVAEACAGLRFLIATVVLSTLYAHLVFRRWSKIIVFVLASFIVPVIANGFRALGIVLLAHYTDNKLAVGADHIVYGWGFSVAILMLLFFIGARFRDSDDERPPRSRASKKMVSFSPMSDVISTEATSRASDESRSASVTLMNIFSPTWSCEISLS